MTRAPKKSKKQARDEKLQFVPSEKLLKLKAKLQAAEQAYRAKKQELGPLADALRDARVAFDRQEQIEVQAASG